MFFCQYISFISLCYSSQYTSECFHYHNSYKHVRKTFYACLRKTFYLYPNYELMFLISIMDRITTPFLKKSCMQLPNRKEVGFFFMRLRWNWEDFRMKNIISTFTFKSQHCFEYCFKWNCKSTFIRKKNNIFQIQNSCTMSRIFYL